MYKAKDVLYLIKEAVVSTDTDAQLTAGSSNFDLTGFVPGSIVTVDITQDDPKTYEVVEVDGDYVIIKDTESEKTYRLPVSKVALQEIDSPYTGAELDVYQVDGDNPEDSESTSDTKTVDNFNKIDSDEVKKSGLSVAVVKSFANQFINNQKK